MDGFWVISGYICIPKPPANQAVVLHTLIGEPQLRKMSSREVELLQTSLYWHCTWLLPGADLLYTLSSIPPIFVKCECLLCEWHSLCLWGIYRRGCGGGPWGRELQGSSRAVIELRVLVGYTFFENDRKSNTTMLRLKNRLYLHS